MVLYGYHLLPNTCFSVLHMFFLGLLLVVLYGDVAANELSQGAAVIAVLSDCDLAVGALWVLGHVPMVAGSALDVLLHTTYNLGGRALLCLHDLLRLQGTAVEPHETPVRLVTLSHHNFDVKP